MHLFLLYLAGFAGHIYADRGAYSLHLWLTPYCAGVGLKAGMPKCSCFLLFAKLLHAIAALLCASCGMHRLQQAGHDGVGQGLLGCCRRKAHPDPEIAALVEQSRRDAGLYKGKKPPMTPQVWVCYGNWPPRCLRAVLAADVTACEPARLFVDLQQVTVAIFSGSLVTAGWSKLFHRSCTLT